LSADAPTRIASDVRVTNGGGIEGRVDSRDLRLGQRRFALDDASARDDDGAVVLAEGSRVIATFHPAERVREHAHDTLAALAADGLDIEMLSGDAAPRVAAIASRLGIARWRARQSPADKLDRLRELRAGGARVIAIGDGINDAPVLAGADVAIALASGAELAQATGDVILDGERLDALGDMRAIAREALRVLRQNQRWALAYNFAAVPVAALGFVPPWLAAIGMSASSLIVVLNALRIGAPRAQTPSAQPAPTRLRTSP
jgi:Cu2+-exporting ATPase